MAPSRGDNRVRELLDAGELTRTELAAALNVRPAAIDEWADGTDKPAADYLERVARARRPDRGW
jgi:transcriptional regulator with XRE-family HTH domain